MTDKARDRISFRLRKVDGDLLEATQGLSSDTISDLARDGLRLILGIRTTKRVEVTERTISSPAARKAPADESQTAVRRSAPVVFGGGIVNQQRG